MIKRLCCTLTVFLALPVTSASALMITFENFAPPGAVINVNPAAPYTEAGFTLTPTNALSAVFDSAADVDFPGNTTDFFGFEESNVITLTGPAPFTLNSLIIGPTTISSTPTISMTILGNVLGGGTLTGTFAGLSTATSETLNWANLTSVVFRTTNDAGLDDIVINQVPEPASLALLGAAAVALGARRFRRKHAD
jgi:PEP-CTERM motif